jgi:hypothetical protein
VQTTNVAVDQLVVAQVSLTAKELVAERSMGEKLRPVIVTDEVIPLRTWLTAATLLSTGALKLKMPLRVPTTADTVATDATFAEYESAAH